MENRRRRLRWRVRDETCTGIDGRVRERWKKVYGDWEMEDDDVENDREKERRRLICLVAGRRVQTLSIVIREPRKERTGVIKVSGVVHDE